MTTKNNSEETRKFDEQNGEETQRIENADEETRMAESAENSEDESTRINPAAPVSRKAMSRSPWAARLGFGIGGAALGFGAGYAVSANATTADSSVTGLAPAATPEDEMTPEERADSIPSDRERTVIEDPNDMPASTLNEVKTTEGPAEVKATEEPVDVKTATVAGNNDDHIVGENPVGNTAATAEEPVEVVVNEDPIIVTTPEQSDIILANEHGIHYAYVDDGMSFGEAFAAAREQVGTPGVFEWHGKVYGTYYAEEWNEMSVAGRSEFIHNVDFPEDLNRETPVVEVVPVDPTPEITEEPVVEIHEVATSMNAAGEITNVAHMSIDGMDTYMVDVDGDQIMDIAVIDADGDGYLTENVDVVIPLDEQNITMDDIVAEMKPGVAPAEEPVMDPATEMPVDDDMAMNDFESDTMPDF